MISDDLGWIWLAGTRHGASGFKLSSNESIIQRFNGHTFHSVPLPNSILETINSIKFIKRKDGQLFVKINGRKEHQLFLLNPQTLEFQFVPKPAILGYTTKGFNIFEFEDQLLYIVNQEEKSYLFTIDDHLQFNFLSESIKIENIAHSILLNLPDHFLIGNNLLGTFLFQKDGTFVKRLTKEDIGLENLNADKFYFHSQFVFQGATYARISRLNDYYQYLPKERKWTRAAIFNTLESSSDEAIFAGRTFIDEKSNLVNVRLSKSQAIMHGYLHGHNEHAFKFVFKQYSGFLPKISSRNFEEELIVVNDNTMHVFIISPPWNRTHLTEYSIRSMYPLNEQEVIVATEFNGWFLLNLMNGKEEKLELMMNGLVFEPDLNRNILWDPKGLWSNDADGLILIEKDTWKVKPIPNTKRVSTLTQDSSYIYFGGIGNSLKRLDKSTKSIQLLSEGDSLKFYDILEHMGSIYIATNKGLLSYNDGIKELHQPSSSQDKFMMSIDYRPPYGLLVGTHSGKLFQFDPSTGDFLLIYEDKLKASIASTLVDDLGKIWINTFAGIVAFEPETGIGSRYGTQEGLSHIEANRHSALKMPDGHFLVGTLRGLNYFHPDSLEKKRRKSPILKLTSLSYYQRKNGDLETIVSPQKLADIKSVILPTELRNLELEFGLMGTYLTENLRYRYRLNSDEPWIDLNKSTSVKLNNLSAGSYKMEIQAVDFLGDKIGNSLFLGITAKEFFHKTIWFTLLVTAGTSIILLGFFQFWKRLQQEAFRNALLSKEIEFKKKDLADFAMNITRNQKWRNTLLVHIKNIKAVTGKKKDNFVSILEQAVLDRGMVDENSPDFQEKIDVLNNEFYSTLLEQFPNLTKTEIRLCSLIRMNLENADIAILQNVAPESIYKSRSRLRKKLNLSSETDLNAFLKKL